MPIITPIPRDERRLMHKTIHKTSDKNHARTLTFNVKVKFIPNDKGGEHAPGFRIQTSGGYDIGAAWKKVSQAERPYLSVTLDAPSFPATISARLLEEEDDKHQLIWSRSKPTA